MANKFKDFLKIREKPQSSTRVNKPLVMIIGVVLFLAIAFAITAAFTQSNKVKKQQDVTTNQLSPTIDPQIASLPANYQDVAGIKKYLEMEKPVIPDSVKEELDQLKKSQEDLQKMLADLKNTKPEHKNSTYTPLPEKQISSAEIQQARNSGLFFPGATPLPLTDKDKDNTQANQNNKDSQANRYPDYSSSNASSYDKQNMQGQKLKFLNSDNTDEDVYNPHTLQSPASKYEVMAGTYVTAALSSALNTSIPGEVIAKITDDVYDSVDGQYLLIPKGSVLIGESDSQVAYGQERILLAFSRIILPITGESIVINKTGGADLQGASGLAADVNNHWGSVLGAAFISTVLSIGAGYVAGNNNNNNGQYPSAGQNAGNSAATNISQVGQQLTDKAINVQPELTLPAGYQFTLKISKDLILKPYTANSENPVPI